MNKNNMHYVPIIIQDIVAKLNDKTVGENERMNLVLRLEVVRDYCAWAVRNHVVGGVAGGKKK